jgi:hypothetical protein
MFEGLSRRDLMIALAICVLGVLAMVAGVADDTPDPEGEAAIRIHGLLSRGFAVPLFLLVTAPLLWRRVAPIHAAGASIAALAVNEALTGSGFLRCGVVLPTAYLLAFAAARHRDGGAARLGLGLALALSVSDLGITFGPAEALYIAAAPTAASWVLGRLVRSRAGMVEELELRTAELRSARDERARLEVATDRARVSVELDELLHHRLARLAAAAEAGGGGDATAALAAIERESRATLEEMRAVVGGLRATGEDPPTAPQPALTHLESLIRRAKGAGAQLEVEGSPRVLPAAVELSAYRIVEQLLAALDDAPGVVVRVGFGDDALELGVTGPARRGARASIERARERALSQRGTLDATVRGGRAEANVALPLAVTV